MKLTRAQEIASRVDQLPVLPVQVGQLTALLADPRATTDDIERIVRPDPSLTAGVLKMSNSAFAYTTSPITSVRAAVVRIGMARVLDLALGNAFRSLMPPKLPGYGLGASHFWRHCASVAVLADRIGTSIVPGTAYFTAGLLHDMGKLVASAFLGKEVPELRDAAPLADLSGERTLLDTDHTELGIAVARRWKLPEIVSCAARWHHTPMLAPQQVRVMACVVHVANALAHSLEPEVGHPTEVDPQACAELGLDDARLQAVVADAVPKLEGLVLALSA